MYHSLSFPTATGLKSILKKTVRYSTGTPVHYFETTKSAVTPLATSQPTKNVKISKFIISLTCVYLGGGCTAGDGEFILYAT